jgi:hypothetical protein
MDVEKLIEAVRSQPVLYDFNRKFYKDSEKSAAWNEIAEELGDFSLEYFNMTWFPCIAKHSCTESVSIVSHRVNVEG